MSLCFWSDARRGELFQLFLVCFGFGGFAELVGEGKDFLENAKFIRVVRVIMEEALVNRVGLFTAAKAGLQRRQDEADAEALLRSWVEGESFLVWVHGVDPFAFSFKYV